jgi:hypothetical protein
MGDIPQLIHREYAGRALKVAEVQDMFKRTCKIWEGHSNRDPGTGDLKEGGTNIEKVGLAYNPECFEHKKVLIDQRMGYMSELLR